MLLDKCVTEDICLVADLIIEHDGAIKIESDSLHRYNYLLPIKIQDKILKLYKNLSIQIKEKIINNLEISTMVIGGHTVAELPNHKMDASQQIYNNHEIPPELLTKIEKLFTKYEINQQNQDDILKDIKIIATQSDQKQKFPNIFSCLSKIGGFAQDIHKIQQLIDDWRPIFQSLF